MDKRVLGILGLIVAVLAALIPFIFHWTGPEIWWAGFAAGSVMHITGVVGELNSSR
jgi:hypothetical protein